MIELEQPATIQASGETSPNSDGSLIPSLQVQLAALSVEEQILVADLLMRAKANGGPEHQLTPISLVHPYFKADPVYASGQFEEMEKAKMQKAPWPVKQFIEAETIALPKEFLPINMTLAEALESRSSTHDFGSQPLSLQKLSTFLHYTYGVKRYAGAYNIKNFPVRMAPSAGGLQPVDLYLVINNVEEMRKGLYYYDPIEHALKLLDEGNMRRHMVRYCLFEDWIGYAPVVFISVCNLNRVMWKYSHRGYRFVHVDTGVLTENMYLVGTALGLATCAVAGYFDDMLNELLQINGRDEFATLVFTIGNKPFS